MKSFLTFVRDKKNTKYTYVIVALAVMGVATMLFSFAATSNVVSTEAESGVISGNACPVSNSFASGNSAISFGKACKILFVSTTGNDSNTGNSQAQAFKTITKAVAEANDPNGNRIRILAGDYVETVRIAKNNITIEPFGNGNVNIIGAIPELITGSGISWTYDEPGVYTTVLPGNRSEATTEGNAIYGSDGKQQWSYANDWITGVTLPGNYPGMPGPRRPGASLYNFLFQNYIKVRTNAGPPTTPLYIGAAMSTLDILNANNIKINSVNGSRLKLSYGSQNVLIRNSNKVTINDLDITGGTYAIALYDSSEVSITKNKIRGEFGDDIYYREVKEYTGSVKTMENAAIKTQARTQNINKIAITDNEMSGYWTAISMFTDWGRGATAEYYTDDSVISNNLIHDMTGVGIEPEIPARNLTVKGNTVYDTFEPFSPAPAIVGPTYVYENLFVSSRTLLRDAVTGELWQPENAIKMNNDTPVGVPQNIQYYNNTFYYPGRWHNFRMTVHSTPGLITSNVSFINNIFYSTDNVILDGTGRQSDGIEFDGNIFWSEKSAPDRYYAWNSLYDSANSYASLSGAPIPSQWTANVEGNPTFNCVDPANPSCFRPSASFTKPSSLQTIPGGFAESARMNTRTRIGAFE
ncbi:MAG: right-handed parallel beta-helix repeat-containing protein [Candidatus Saccharibacteria bacterium]